MNANKKACKLKNIILHKKLTASCTAQTVSEIFHFFSLSIYILPALIPIRVNRIVHTAGNTTEGGVSGGCCIWLKRLIPELVINADKAPVNKETAIKKI